MPSRSPSSSTTRGRAWVGSGPRGNQAPDDEITEVASALPAYEPTHPGELLLETVIPATVLGMGEVARRLGVTRQTLNNLTARRSGVTAEMALRLSALFGSEPGMWLGMQSQFDLWHARHRMAAEIGSIARVTAAGGDRT